MNKGEGVKSRIGDRHEARSMYALSLHVVYCNIYVRHCNKNANSFVIKCFSSPAPAASELKGRINPSMASIARDEIEP